MQQTSGSCCRCGDESALDVVAAVVVSFLLMVRGNSFQSIVGCTVVQWCFMKRRGRNRDGLQIERGGNLLGEKSGKIVVRVFDADLSVPYGFPGCVQVASSFDYREKAEKKGPLPT